MHASAQSRAVGRVSRGGPLIGQGANRNNASPSPNLASRSRTASAGPTRSGSAGALAKKNGPESVSQVESQFIQNLQQQIYYLELENAYLKNQLKKGRNPTIVGESDRYLERLRRMHEEKEKYEIQLKEKEQECHSLLKERHLLHERLKRADDEHNRDKTSLSEEIVELRKQLDDFGPELSRKQTNFSQLNSDFQEISKRLRNAQRANDILEAQLNQKIKEEKALESLEAERREELDRLLTTIKELEVELGEERARNRSTNEEVAMIRGHLREHELQAKKDRAVADKIAEENSVLIKENAQLAAKVTQAHALLEQYESQIRYEHVLSESAHLRENQRQLRHQLSKLQELFKLEENKTKKLTAQVSKGLTEQESGQNAVKDTQTKLQVQLESLEELSRNMSNENKQLRSQKIFLESRLEETRNVLANKDMQLQTMQDRIHYLEQHQKDLVRQFEDEMQIQESKFRELERTATQCREISRSLRHAAVLGKSTTPDTPLSNGVP